VAAVGSVKGSSAGRPGCGESIKRAAIYTPYGRNRSVKLQLARIPTRAYFSRMLLIARASVLALVRVVILLLAPVRERRRTALSLGSAQASSLKPHAGPAVADVTRVEENNVGTIESFLNCGERARTRIGPTALQVFNRNLREARRPSQLGLRPVEQPAGRAYLSGCDHPDTIDEPTRNSNYRLPYVSLLPIFAQP
jgi:hypothetical protein